MSRKVRSRLTSPPAEKAKTPPFTGDDWDFVERVLESPVARTVVLWGPPGTGKTFTSMGVGRRGREVYMITLTPETPAAELRGFWMPKGDRFEWQDGPLVKAMRDGSRVVLNELSHASHDVLAILHAVLESKETARLTLPNLETVQAAEGFQLIATDNFPPTDLPIALQDRFDSRLYVDRPHPGALARLSEDLREAALRTFDLEPERAVSIRAWLKVQDYEEAFGRRDALRAVFGRERGEQLFKATALALA